MEEKAEEEEDGGWRLPRAEPQNVVRLHTSLSGVPEFRGTQGCHHTHFAISQ